MNTEQRNFLQERITWHRHMVAAFTRRAVELKAAGDIEGETICIVRAEMLSVIVAEMCELYAMDMRDAVGDRRQP